MNSPSPPKSVWRNLGRPVLGGVLGCLFGALLGCIASVATFGLYTMTLSRADYQSRYGDMGGVAMIEWGLIGIRVGVIVLGALGVWWGFWLNRVTRSPS
jgi:hypothetical protein